LTDEFHWENSSDRQTTGILMWLEPFIIKRDGQEIAKLLMDTQGCFDDKTTTSENSQIFLQVAFCHQI
jgi:atlastin